MADFDIIVVGAGVAGGIFAASQPKNIRVLVVERDLAEQERIVGELMQPGGIQALQKLDLAYLLDGIDAQEVKGYQIIKGEEQFLLHYKDIEDGISGLGLRNGKFLSNIRKELERKDNVCLVQGNVIDFLNDEDNITGIKYTNEDGAIISQTANLTIVCDGPMSILRNKLCAANKQVSSYFVGLILKDLQLDNPAYGHMIISGASPILVYPIKTNAYRILIDYPGTKPPRIGKKSIEEFKEIVLKNLPEAMKGAFLNAIEEGNIKVMPNHIMKGQAFQKNGAVLLGDSFNMRHPLTGGGMTACFKDIICLNSFLKDIDFNDRSLLQIAVQEYYKKRSKGVASINILANALYRVFMDKELKDACFEYLKRGGNQANEPLAILAGLNTDKKNLLKHFYKLAMQHPMHFITAPKKQLRMYKSSKKIMFTTLKEENVPAIK